jgi:hypothetical protein
MILSNREEDRDETPIAFASIRAIRVQNAWVLQRATHRREG